MLISAHVGLIKNGVRHEKRVATVYGDQRSAEGWKSYYTGTESRVVPLRAVEPVRARINRGKGYAILFLGQASQKSSHVPICGPPK